MEHLFKSHCHFSVSYHEKTGFDYFFYCVKSLLINLLLNKVIPLHCNVKTDIVDLTVEYDGR